MPPVTLSQAQLRQLETSLLGRVNIAPRSITEDKLAVGAATAAIIREGAIFERLTVEGLSVTVLTGGTISGETIIIADGGIIRSFNYVPGTSGWAIDAAGSAEFQDVTVRGILQAETGSDLPVDYVSDGNLAATVDLTAAGSISANYTAGVAGWAIDGLGNAEFNDVTVRGVVESSDIIGGIISIGGTGPGDAGFHVDVDGAIYLGDAAGVGAASTGAAVYISENGQAYFQELFVNDGGVGGSLALDASDNFVISSTGTGGAVNDLELYATDGMYLTCNDNGGGNIHLTPTTGGAVIVKRAHLLSGVGPSGDDEGTNIQFTDASDVRQGYVGYALNDDLRIWNEAAAGAMFFATNNVSRGSIAVDGSWTFGSSGAPQAVTHAFYNEEDGQATVVIINRTPTASTVGVGLDIYLGAVGSTNDPGASDWYVQFRRGDGTIRGTISGTAGGNVAFNTTSDQRFKTAVTDDPIVGAQAFDLVPWCSWEWTETGIEDAGVIAQELHQVPRWRHLVAPGGMVSEKHPETGEPFETYRPWGVNYVPLIGAIGAKLVDVDRRLRALEATRG
jgi:hypothetical protein